MLKHEQRLADEHAFLVFDDLVRLPHDRTRELSFVQHHRLHEVGTRFERRHHPIAAVAVKPYPTARPYACSASTALIGRRAER